MSNKNYSFNFYLLFFSCLTSTLTIPFFNKSGEYPLSYLLPILLLASKLNFNPVFKKESLLVILLSILLLINGTQLFTVFFIAIYLFIYVSCTNKKYYSSTNTNHQWGVIFLPVFMIGLSFVIGDNFSSDRYLPRLKGLTLEASYLGMTMAAAFWILNTKFQKIIALIIIIITQSGLALVTLSLVNIILRRIFFTIFLFLSLYLLLTPTNIDFYLSNSLLVRFLGIEALKSLNLFQIFFGAGIGYSDAFLSSSFNHFGLSETYNGSFLFGAISDFGLLGSTLIGFIALKRIPLTLLIIIHLNFSTASPYLVFITLAWQLSINRNNNSSTALNCSVAKIFNRFVFGNARWRASR